MTIKIGTRGSKLALIQANKVQAALLEKKSDLKTEIITIKTTGDKEKDKPLVNIGGKELFLKEIEESLLAKEIDIAVHSLKDVPAIITPGLTIAGFLEREDPRDAFLSSIAENLEDLPNAAVVGTSSPRRAVQLLKLRPDLSIIPFRGNVDSRIRKIQSEEVDATLLAVAGLKRLGIDSKKYKILNYKKMIPAVGQGVICVECRKDDNSIITLLDSITHVKTKNLILAERGFTETIKGNCKTPLGAHALYIGEDQIKLTAFLASEDGKRFDKITLIEKTANAYELGQNAANDLLNKLG